MLGFKAMRSAEVRGWRAAQRPPAGSNRQRDVAHARAQALFRWLLRSCMLYELFRWCGPRPSLFPGRESRLICLQSILATSVGCLSQASSTKDPAGCPSFEEG
jgi:hypothetical protein